MGIPELTFESGAPQSEVCKKLLEEKSISF